MSLSIISAQLKRVLIPCVLVAVACCSLLFGWSDHANAANKAAAVVQDRAEQEFDRVAGEGSVNQIKGKAQEGLGRVQRELDDDVEGTARELRGKAQKNFGRTQQAADEAANAAEDQAQGLVDKVKDIFD